MIAADSMVPFNHSPSDQQFSEQDSLIRPTVLTPVKFGSDQETNPQRIEARLKQIQFGKNTIGYDNYVATVPK
jgi:hypothetical protein